MDRIEKHAPRLILIPALAWLALIAYDLRADLMDDAYISLRYLHNLLAGNGLVFNPGERVEGITNIGWVLFLAPFAAVMGEIAAAKIMGFILACATVILSGLIAEKLAPEQNRLFYILPVPLLVAFQADFSIFSNLGMETSLLSTVLLLALYFIITGRSLIIVALLSAIAFAIHPETVLIFPLFTLAVTCDLGINIKEEWNKLRFPLLVFVIAVAAITLARYLYFGDLLPNTFHSKASGLHRLLWALMLSLLGKNVNLGFPFNSLPGFIFLLIGSAALERRGRVPTNWLWVSVAVGIFFGCYAPADWTEMGRYFAPYTPLAAILMVWGIVEAVTKFLEESTVRHRRLTNWIAFGGILLLLCITCGLEQPETNLARARYPGYILFGRNLVAPSKWLNDNLPKDAVIATRRIGAAGYYSERRIFDYKFGLVDREAAKVLRAFGKDLGYPSNPVLQSIWQQRKPDYLLEDSFVIDHLIDESHGSADRFELHGLFYREIKRWPLGKKVDWVLCERIK